MWRASLVAGVVVAALSLAHADDPSAALRAQVADQLGAELDVITRTLATVSTKLTEAETVRVDRLRAAYRVLRAPLRSGASAADRMAAARRRAGARLLVDRDARERDLLATEAAHLRTAHERTVVATRRLPTVALPASLGRPARGAIARRFGTLEHERSRATLSRRGLDLEVDTRAPATAPADGTVRYAGPIRGLDDGVILDHGDYFTVIAKLDELTVPVGATVHRGDRLGHAARSRVYLEVRVRVGPGGVPIDPEPLLEARPDDSR